MPSTRDLTVSVAVLASLLALPACAARREPPVVPPQSVDMDEEVLEKFGEEIREYVKLHRKLTEKIPMATPTWSSQQIADRQRLLTVAIQASRRDKTQGNIFKPEVEAAFRRVLMRELTGPNAAAMLNELRSGNPSVEGVPQQRNPQAEQKKAVTLKVNAYYPDDAPLSSVPPSLLLKLPALPEQVRYRFVGRNLILRDTEANVILDYLPDVIPGSSIPR